MFCRVMIQICLFFKFRRRRNHTFIMIYMRTETFADGVADIILCQHFLVTKYRQLLCGTAYSSLLYPLPPVASPPPATITHSLSLFLYILSFHVVVNCLHCLEYVFVCCVWRGVLYSVVACSIGKKSIFFTGYSHMVDKANNGWSPVQNSSPPPPSISFFGKWY